MKMFYFATDSPRYMKIIIMLLLSIFFGKYSTVNADSVTFTEVNKAMKTESLKMFNSRGEVEDKQIQDMFLGCFNEKNKQRNDFHFIYQEEWNNKVNPGLGFTRTTKSEDTVYCYFRTKKEKHFLKVKIETEPTANNTSFPEILDISEKLYKKSIQKRELSCESSAAADIISTILNKNISETEIIKKLPKSHYNKTAKEIGEKKYWGNPEKGYVGYIDQYNDRGALQWKYEGYGVYEQPISEVYSDYGIRSSIINEENRIFYNIYTPDEQLTYILKEVNKGNYIQLWGDMCTYPEHEDGIIDYEGREAGGKVTQTEADRGLNGQNPCIYPYKERKLEWYYRDKEGNEEQIIGLNGEHAFYLLGYRGGVENPTHIIVWDTNTGKHTYKTEEWMRKWEKMGYRTIIVYPEK